MNRRLVAGVLAGAAAVALGVLGATGVDTYSNPVAEAGVPGNAVGAGMLQLDLHGGGADAQLDFRRLTPGAADRRLFWVAANDANSSVVGTLAIRFGEVVDTPAPCAVSRGKALGEIQSGIGGCTVSGEHISGTPQQGNLSRLVAVRIDYKPAAGDAASCAAGDGERSLLADDSVGNLRGVGGRAYILKDGTTPLVLAPGQGACLSVTAVWPPGANPADGADPEHPTDNAAQGDALRMRVRFELSQVTS